MEYNTPEYLTQPAVAAANSKEARHRFSSSGANNNNSSVHRFRYYKSPPPPTLYVSSYIVAGRAFPHTCISLFKGGEGEEEGVFFFCCCFLLPLPSPELFRSPFLADRVCVCARHSEWWQRMMAGRRRRRKREKSSKKVFLKREFADFYIVSGDLIKKIRTRWHFLLFESSRHLTGATWESERPTTFLPISQLSPPSPSTATASCGAKGRLSTKGKRPHARSTKTKFRKAPLAASDCLLGFNCTQIRI